MSSTLHVEKKMKPGSLKMSTGPKPLGLLLLCLAVIYTTVAVGEMTFDPRLLGGPWFDKESVLLTTMVTGFAVSCAGAMVLITRRIVFSTLVTLVVAIVIILASRTKFSYLGVRLMYQDLLFYLRNQSEIYFFIDHYFEIFIFIIAASIFLPFALYIFFRIERITVNRIYSIPLFLIGILFAYIGSEAITPQVKSDIFFRSAYDQRHLSTLLVSAVAFSEAIDRPMRITGPRAPNVVEGDEYPHSEPDLHEPRESTYPDIITILHESSIDPGIYFAGEPYQVPQDFFASGDGVIRRLQVETFGGRTWISEYGFLLGINASYLGPTYEFLGVIRENRFKNTFPGRLKELGYTTIANYPSPPTFMNTGRFYRTLGFDIINDPDSLGLRIVENNRPRDRSYYERVISDLNERFAKSKKNPVFYFVWTTATHYPYSTPMHPDLRADEIVVGDEGAEYARRQRIARDDLKWFEGELRRRFPNRKFLLAGFGDHHPLITAGYFSESSGVFKVRDPNEASNMTYYRINGINFEADYESLTSQIEIGFLADSILAAARLPLGPSFSVRAQLRHRCRGLWLGCADAASVGEANSLLSEGPTSLFK